MSTNPPPLPPSPTVSTKHSHSADESYVIVYDLGLGPIASFEDGNDCSETVTHAKFEELNLNVSRKALKPVKQVLKDASMKREDIEDVLVDGSTRRTCLPTSAIPSSSTTSATATRVRLSRTRTRKPSGVFGYAMLGKRFDRPFLASAAPPPATTTRSRSFIPDSERTPTSTSQDNLTLALSEYSASIFNRLANRFTRLGHPDLPNDRHDPPLPFFIPSRVRSPTTTSADA
ncbi:ATPase with role in protein import into the ER [Tulasnella sp. UAMH 9824]|nr:ATPase with role in protein import into the ER [Tulasnella sp. UAMH 9824]